MSAYLIDIRRFRSSTSSRNRKLYPIRRILRNHVARLGANSPSNKPLLKKKKKNANYLCLINIHDIRPHRYAPQSNPLSVPLPPRSVRSSSLDLPASSFFQPTDPLLATPPPLSSIQPSVPSTKKDYGNS